MADQKATTQFASEFGLLPPELLFKCHEFIRAYHTAHGSGWSILKAQIILSNHSPYLRQRERAATLQFRLFEFVGVVGLVAVLAAIFWDRWMFVVAAIAAVSAYGLSRAMKFTLIQIRALVLSNEMLAANFAGWGDIFSKAREQSVRWLAMRELGQESLFDAYMPLDRRAEFAEDFKPSSRSVDQAYQDALRSLRGEE